MSSKVNPIAIAVFCVLGAVIITLALLPVMAKVSAYTPPPRRGSWAPPFDPGNLPSVKPSNPQVCLPGTLGYNGLVTCTRQTDCKSCTDDSTLECVTINNTNSQLVEPDTKQLNPPVPVHLYKKANGTCSGRGVQKSCDDPNAPDNCQDYWCDCGSQYTHANNDPTNCDVQVLNVTQPGSYCLPSYVNACNPYTSNTMLSNIGTGPQWVCECKYNNPQIFQQNAEGNDCSVPIVCGSLEPQYVGSQVARVLMYNNTDGQNCIAVPGSNNTNWQLCDSYPNQLVSSNPMGTMPCNLPTQQTTVQIDKNYAYQQYDVSPLADPRCKAQTFTNTCTVQTAFDKDGNVVATQVIRGTNTLNDPKLSRLWPPYPEVLPVAMQACPDNWTGSGTDADPCDDTKGFTFAYLDQYGQWNGKYLSLQDLRNVGYKGDSATVCSGDTDCKSPQICVPGVGVCATPCPAGCPEGTGCVNGVCSAINDASCNVSLTAAAVGLPGTLGAEAWQTVNTGCSPAPQCLETAITMQQITRGTDSNNLFSLASSDNFSQSTCTSNVTAPTACYCPIAAQKVSCQQDSTCGAGNVCGFSPVFSKPCSSPTDCGGKPCNSGKCSTTCQGNNDCDQSQGEFCKEGVCTVGFCNCDVTGSTYSCKDQSISSNPCQAATGYMARPYNGALDGPVVDDNGLALGGACSCTGFSMDGNGQKVPLVSGALLDPSLAWTCVPDPCFVPGTKYNNYYDPLQKQCVCGADSAGGTYYSWNTNNGVPTCQRDPCNPNGTTSPIQVTCSDDSQCSTSAVACSNKKCYIWTGKPCTENGGSKQCAEGLFGGQSVECLQAADSNFYCAVEDTTRSGCNQASDCSLGICNKKTKLCTGGCVCSGGTDPYFTDANPLHSACSNPCVFNPCGSNGVCQSNDDGTYKCNCLPGFTGDNCEIRTCLPSNALCTGDTDCCSGDCSPKFLAYESTCK